MSLLLDALRKADRERRSGQPLSPFDEPPPPSNSPRAEPRPVRAAPAVSSQRALLAVLWGILIAVLLLALVVWQRSPSDHDTHPAAAAPTALPVPTAPMAATMPTPTPQRVATPDTLASFESVYSLDELAMPALQPITPTAAVAVTPAPTAPREPIRETVIAPAPSTLVNPPHPSAEKHAPLASDVIQRRDLPIALRDRIPNYAIDVHVYNDDPSRRFILIAGQRFVEGSLLEGGNRLLEIAPRGLVIDVDGQKVLIQRPG